MHSTFAVGGALDTHSPFRRRAEELGLACQLAARLSIHAQTPLSGFASLVQKAQQVGQFKVYLNGYGECVAYVIWALLSPDVEQEYVDCNPREGLQNPWSIRLVRSLTRSDDHGHGSDHAWP